jgi:hypothetical protein
VTVQWRFPFVRANQRIIPRDFLRLASKVEDILADVGQRFVFNAEDAALKKRGIVLYGLKTTAAVAGGVTQATVTAGAALLPDTGIGGEVDRKWRLAPLPSQAQVTLTAGAGDRYYMIQIGLAPEPGEDALEEDASLDAGSVEERDFRRLNAANAEEVYTDTVKTYRRPLATLTAVLTNTPANPTPSAGTSLLSVVRIDSDGNVVSVVDWRNHAWPAPSNWDANATDQRYYRSARDALARLFSVVSAVLTAEGKLKAILNVYDNGPSVLLGTGGGVPFVNFITRELSAGKLTSLADVIGQRFGFTSNDAETVAQTAQGTKFTSNQLARAWISVDVNPTTGEARWSGQNVLGLDHFTDIGGNRTNHFRVRFDLAALAGGAPIIDHNDPSRWCIEAYPRHCHETDGHFPWYAAGRRGAGPVVSVRGDGGYNVVVNTSYVYAEAGTGNVYMVDKPFGFVLEVHGPYPLDDADYAAADLVADEANSMGT